MDQRLQNYQSSYTFLSSSLTSVLQTECKRPFSLLCCSHHLYLIRGKRFQECNRSFHLWKYFLLSFLWYSLWFRKSPLETSASSLPPSWTQFMASPYINSYSFPQVKFWLVGFLDVVELFISTAGRYKLCLAAYLGNWEKGVTTLWSHIWWSHFQESSQEHTHSGGCSYLQRMAICQQSHTVFHCRTILKVLNPGQLACMVLNPFPCLTWHPLPQTGSCVHHMWVVVQSMDSGASLPWHTSKGVRQVPWQHCSASVHGGNSGLHRAQWVCQLGSWAVLTAQGSLEHKLCMGYLNALAHLLFRNNFFPLIVFLQD